MQPYLAERAALIASAEAGLDAARALSALSDEAVRNLTRAASSTPRGRWAIVALGGWGAGALLPDSDLDLLVLAEAGGAKARPFVEAVLYPLWDAGIKVGHQVRTPREQARAMRDDTATMTAGLTARFIVGDREWAERAMAFAVGTLARRRDTYLRDLSTRERPGSPYLLEPDLKSGRGGRRDFDEMTWTAALAAGHPARDPASLVHAGILSADELATLTSCALDLAKARWTLQREGHGDEMSLEASELLPDAERVQRALAETALLLDRVRDRVGGSPSTETAALTSAEAFALLDRGESAIPELETAAQSGRLDALVPGFGHLMTVRRPGLGHRYAVGDHCLRTAASLRAIEPGSVLERSLEDVNDFRALQVAALVHDVGKGTPGPDHARRGVPAAMEAARRFGLSSDQAVEVADLVRLHLELVETAFRDDLDDEDALLRSAARIGRRELVPALHVLSAADSASTGGTTWNPWLAALVGTLVTRLDAALSPEVDGAGLAEAGESTRADALAALEDTPVLAEFVRAAPLRYLASRSPEQIIAEAELLAAARSKPPGERIALAVRPGPTAGSQAATVAAADAPELFARIAGALSLAGLDILGADAFGAPDGMTLDTFTVASATLRPIEPETWKRFERFLTAALHNRLELETRLTARGQHYKPAASGETIVETDASPGYQTIIRVTTPDHPGLLYGLARAVSSLGLDIRWARAITVEGMAIDTFHVAAEDGSAVTDPGVLGHLAMHIRASA